MTLAKLARKIHRAVTERRRTRDKPVRLNFRREETASCSKKVIIAAFKSADLPTGQQVAVELLPEQPVSHVFVTDIPAYPKLLLITDAAVNLTPDLNAKAQIVQNAVEVAHMLGIPRPKVAALSAVETVNLAIASTLDAAALAIMARRGQIADCLVDGPLAFDNAISARAAREKGIASEVAGDADIVLVPDLVSGNILAKNPEYLAEATAAGILVGLSVPVVLSSRADPPPARLASLALAAVLHHRTSRTPRPAPDADAEPSFHCAPQAEDACCPLPELLFSDLERLVAIHRRHPFQVVFAGKAHPQDGTGKQAIEGIHRRIAELSGVLPIVFLPGYGMDLARYLVSGADVWLNTPLPPLEASGTSGMKAALNGVLNFGVPDGWWQEAAIEDDSGWAIGDGMPERADQDAGILYDKLEHKVLPLYYDDRAKWIWMMKQSTSKIAYYFNSHRMMRRYAAEAYLR